MFDALVMLCLDSHMWASHVFSRGHRAMLLLAGVLLLVTHVAAAADAPPAQTGCLTIGQIQGPGGSSALDGRKGLGCVTGCVTGVAADGFYIQSARPDADPKTSEGIFVYRWSGWTNPRKLKPGDLLEIRDFGVQEFYGSTEIVKLKSDRETAYRRLGVMRAP